MTPLPSVGSPTTQPGVLSVAVPDVQSSNQLQEWDAPLVEDVVVRESTGTSTAVVEEKAAEPVAPTVTDLLDELAGTEDDPLVGPFDPDTTKVVPPPRG